MIDCLHENFKAQVKVNRVEREEGVVAGFCADITIACDGCNCPFVFLGVGRVGLSFEQPMTSLDATELRQPIAPDLEWTNGEPLPGYELHTKNLHRHT